MITISIDMHIEKLWLADETILFKPYDNEVVVCIIPLFMLCGLGVKQMLAYIYANGRHSRTCQTYHSDQATNENWKTFVGINFGQLLTDCVLTTERNMNVTHNLIVDAVGRGINWLFMMPFDWLHPLCNRICQLVNYDSPF